jgi:hypothetical protein
MNCLGLWINCKTEIQQIMMKAIAFVIGLMLFALSNRCSAQKHVVGANETYRYWADQEPDSTVKPINGEYWNSSHFTKEYKLYMELKVKPEWTKSFAAYNNLKSGKYEILSDAPKWFKPPKDFEVWDGSQGSKYFINSKTGHMFMYEVQL